MVASDRIKGRNIVEVHDNVGAAETESVQLNGNYLLVGRVGVKVGSSGLGLGLVPCFRHRFDSPS